MSFFSGARGLALKKWMRRILSTPSHSTKYLCAPKDVRNHASIREVEIKNQISRSIFERALKKKKILDKFKNRIKYINTVKPV